MTPEAQHFRRLESMYLAAPINGIFRPKIVVDKARAEIEIELSSDYHHSAGAVHGSVYFKMLDDAAFFAANSLEPLYFVLTTSFTTYLLRPVVHGRLRSVGKVVGRTGSQFLAESVLYDQRDREIARGHGVFVRGKNLLETARGYGNGNLLYQDA